MTKGGWRGGGRPKGSTSKKPTRDVSQHIRWTREEWAEIDQAAKAKGLKPSDYVRRVALAAKVKKERKG